MRSRSVTDPLTPVQLDRLIQVVDYVSKLYGLTREQLLTATDHTSAEARFVVTYAGVFVLDHSFTQIAVALGTRHRASLSLGVKMIQRRRRVDTAVDRLMTFTADFALKLLDLKPEAKIA